MMTDNEPQGATPVAKEKILVVEDEEDILELVRYNLGREGYQVSGATTGEDAIREAKAQGPDLIILDLMLPGIDGLTVCRILQADPATNHIPIVMLTAKGDEADIVTGLELGAEDYVTKPFSPKVLLARVRRILRRGEVQPAAPEQVVQLGEIAVDSGRHEVRVGGEPVELTLTEFRILESLARKPGWVFTRYQLVDASRGEDSEVTDRSVDVHIVSLRRKLGPAGAHIETVRGVGYRMRGQ
jgi:two-component system, OmpR family, alkaline phosphatase synthesis response regulator PhoP